MKRTPSHVRKRFLFFMGLPLLLGSWAGLAFSQQYGIGHYRIGHCSLSFQSSKA